VFTTTCSDPDGWRDIHTIDFIVGRHKVNGDDDRGGEEKGDKDKGDKNNDDDDGDRTIALWVQFDENRNVIRLYDPDLEVWREGSPGANVTLSSRFADLHLAGTHVQGSGPTGPSVQVTWEVVFKDSAIKKNYKQFLKITDDAGSSTDFDRVGSWKVTR
jgi:hypothetical protein